MRMKTVTTCILSVLMCLAIQKHRDSQTTIAIYSATVVSSPEYALPQESNDSCDDQDWVSTRQPIQANAEEQRPGSLNATKVFNQQHKPTNECPEIRDELVLRTTRSMRTPHETVTKRLYA